MVMEYDTAPEEEDDRKPRLPRRMWTAKVRLPTMWMQPVYLRLPRVNRTVHERLPGTSVTEIARLPGISATEIVRFPMVVMLTAL